MKGRNDQDDPDDQASSQRQQASFPIYFQENESEPILNITQNIYGKLEGLIRGTTDQPVVGTLEEQLISLPPVVKPLKTNTANPLVGAIDEALSIESPRLEKVDLRKRAKEMEKLRLFFELQT